MPRGQLNKEDRLRISNTRLKNVNLKYRTTIRELRRELRIAVKTRDARIKELESKLEDKESQRKKLQSYLYKPNKEEKDTKPLGKRPGSRGYQRSKPSDKDVTEQYTFNLNRCPICNNSVGKAVETTIKYQEDIVLIPHKILKKFTITRHWCGHCDTFVRAQNLPPMDRIGINVLGYVLYARYRLRLPFNKIKQSLKDLHNFDISEGEIANELNKARILFGKDHEMIKEFIKIADVVYADETGWRMNGHNWWLWVFVTDNGIRYVVDDSRGKGVPQEVLGDNKNRVLISDFYAVYNKIPGDKQKCWVHLSRDAEHIGGQIHLDIQEAYQSLLQELEKRKDQRDPPGIKQKLFQIEQKHYKEAEAQKIQKRISKYRDELLTCLYHDSVLPENNTAERALRPQVVMRKIFGGSRSLEGAQIHAINTSVIDTKLKENPNFFGVIMPLLKKRLEEKHEEAFRSGE